MAKIDFAPDGNHFHTIKKGSLGKLWDYFNFSLDILTQIRCNPYAKFRLYGEEKLIGELPRKE